MPKFNNALPTQNMHVCVVRKLFAMIPIKQLDIDFPLLDTVQIILKVNLINLIQFTNNEIFLECYIFFGRQHRESIYTL